MAKATGKKVTVVMETLRDHKNVVRFEGDEDVLSNAYVAKAALAKIGNPKSIKVTIEAA